MCMALGFFHGRCNDINSETRPSEEVEWQLLLKDMEPV